MNKRLKVSVVLVAALAAIGALHHFGAPDSTHVDRVLGPGRGGGVVVARGGPALQHCQQAARMIFDVHWAAACMTEVGQPVPGRAPDHPECDLPDDKAAVVNAWLNAAEAQCLAEAGAGT